MNQVCVIIAKNKKKTLHMLNENITSSEDNIMLVKTFLYKLKRLKKIYYNFLVEYFK